MIIETIWFHYDRLGNKLKEPVELRARDVRGKGFYLSSAEYRDIDEMGNMPAIHVCREHASLKTDPYNEDGRPPSVLFIMVLPTVSFCSGVIEIFGFECPNMTWAGAPRPAYEMCKPLSLPKKRLWPMGMDGELIEKPGHRISHLTRQLVRMR